MDDLLTSLPVAGPVNTARPDPAHRRPSSSSTAINGFGVHTMLTVITNFPGLYKNFIFVSVAEVDVGSFKSSDAMDELKRSTGEALQKYVDLARKLGFAAEYRFDLGTDIVETASNLCEVGGQGVPEVGGLRRPGHLPQRTGVIHRLLHNETAFAIQQELRWKGIMTVILPMRINI